MTSASIYLAAVPTYLAAAPIYVAAASEKYKKSVWLIFYETVRFYANSKRKFKLLEEHNDTYSLPI